MLSRGTKRRKGLKLGIGFLNEKFLQRVVGMIFGFIQPCMVLGALSIISFIVYIWFNHLRILYGADYADPEFLCRTLLGIWWLFNIIYNYLSAVLVHAGTSAELFPNIHRQTDAKGSTGLLSIRVLTPLIQDSATDSTSANLEDDQFRGFIQCKNVQIEKDYFFGESMETVRGLRSNPYIWRFCAECQLPKPPRSHHCSICGQCVLNMDHHCPWVASCVGMCNYRYFVLFMFWLCTGCIYYIVNAFAFSGLNFYFIAATYTRRHFRNDPVLRRAQSRVMLGCILCLAVAFAVGCLLTFHIFLCLSGMSTIEMFGTTKIKNYFKAKGQSWRSPSDNGWKKNWQYVFRTYGRFWWVTWCLPMRVDRKELLQEVMGNSSSAD